MRLSFNHYVKLFLSLIIIIFNACNGGKDQEKFKAPVETVFRLDGTQIGISTIISDLKVPWDIEWGPDGQIWYTIQEGEIGKVDPHTGKNVILLNIENKVYRGTTPGLLGMAVYAHGKKQYVFVTYTHKKEGAEIVLRLVRYTFKGDTLLDPLILREIPGNTHHNGSRIVVSPDGKVFWSTGDMGNSRHAQDTSFLEGKILRLNMDGSIPKDNPFPNNPVWAMGFRAPEGLAITPDGILFCSSNGPATDDEINEIKKGGRYKWPLLTEREDGNGKHIIPPMKDWTPTIAPSGIAYYHSDKIPEWNNSILVATLKGSSLRVLKLNDQKDAVLSEKIFFKDKFGRLRDVCVSPSGDVYISTTNRDWKQAGKGGSDDDRIIRIAKINKATDNLAQVDINNPIPEQDVASEPVELRGDGKSLYQSYCSSCHRMDGNGVAGTFPALNASQVVTGGKERLIAILLKGDAAITKKVSRSGEKMPAFNFLKDQQVADILTYIRTSWENQSDSVSIDKVKSIRKELK